MVTFATVNWGNYCGRGREYTNVLFDMVRRNLSQKVAGKFVVFTDDTAGYDEGIETRSLPLGLKGWWNKLYLFKSGVFDDGERIIYLDLDTVITGPLDDIIKYSGQFALLRDFYRPAGLGSGAMAWEAGKWNTIWDTWNQQNRPMPAGGDQEWLEYIFGVHGYKPDLWQSLYPKQIVSYKVHAKRMFPKGAKVVCFHGHPRPHEVKGCWVEQIWKVGGGSSLEMELVANTEDDKLIANVLSAIKTPHPLLDGSEPHDLHAVIVGGGPSLRGSLPEIERRASNGQTIFSTNGTEKILRENGVLPTYHVMLDARPENAEFVPAACKCLYASQCDPAVFAKAEKNENLITIWHPLLDGIQEIIKDDKRPTALVGGGSTVGLKAICVAYIMGYRTIHLYGLDSSYREDAHHAYPQSLNDGERVIDVVCNGKGYKVAPWMATQVDQFKELAAELVSLGVTLVVHGEGLLPDVARAMGAPLPEYGEIELRDGMFWPASDSICHKAMQGAADDVDNILKYCQSRKVAIQAGGNVGVWPKALARHFETVITYEPDPVNFACLSKNVQEENVIATHGALGSDRHGVALENIPNNCGAHFIAGAGKIPVFLIDDLPLESCDLIQLDVEGFELRALQGAAETIKNFWPTIVIEENGLSERYGIRQGDAANWLSQFGYKQVASHKRDVIFKREATQAGVSL